MNFDVQVVDTSGRWPVSSECRLRVPDGLLLRHADTPDGAAGPRDAHGGAHRPTVADTLEANAIAFMREQADAIGLRGPVG